MKRKACIPHPILYVELRDPNSRSFWVWDEFFPLDIYAVPPPLDHTQEGIARYF